MPGKVVSLSFTFLQKELDINALKHYTDCNEPKGSYFGLRHFDG